MTEETAQAVIAALRAGRTLNTICSKRRGNDGWITYRSRFEAYYTQHPQYAAEAGALEIENTKAPNKALGATEVN